MQYRRMGQSGLKLSVFSLGSWVNFGSGVDSEAAEAQIKCAFDAGVNFFDNAEGYEGGESERVMGQAIRKLGLPRDEFCLSSKVFWGGDKPTQLGLCAKHIREACDAALDRLQVDYLDLYYCHRPDPDTPISETVRAMHNLVTQGKVLYWGTSEWSAEQISEAHSFSERYNLTPPSVEQPEYNLFHRERVEKEYQPLYRDYGMGVTSFSPLASGVLTGKYNSSLDNDGRLNLKGYEWLKEKFASEEGQRNLESARKLSELANSLDVPMHHLALAWCLANPNVSSVILGASRLAQLQDNLRALDVLEKLDDTLLTNIEAIVQNKPV